MTTRILVIAIMFVSIIVADCDSAEFTDVLREAKEGYISVEEGLVESFVPIGYIDKMYITEDLIYGRYRALIAIGIKPSPRAVANKAYSVELYESGELRKILPLTWNQPEINVAKVKYIYFPASQQEQDAYSFKDINHIFDVKIKE